MSVRYEFLLCALALGCSQPAPTAVLDAAPVDRVVAPSDVTDARADTALPDAAVDVTDAATDIASADVTDVSPADVTDASPTDVSVTDVSVTDVALTDVSVTDAADVPSGVWVPIAGASCNARERNVATQESPHVDPDAGAIVYLTNPPASGPHYPIWARWGAWPNLPRGYWVHNLEHGGVAYLFRCATGTCDATRDALVAMARTIPMDPACMPDDASPATVRVVITNDNEITTPIAAAAWGWLYAADCVDAPSLRDFYVRHAGMASENFCADGFYP